MGCIEQRDARNALRHAAQNFESNAASHGMPRNGETLGRISQCDLRHLFQRVARAVVRNFDSGNFRKVARLVLPYRIIANQAGKKQKMRGTRRHFFVITSTGGVP